MNKKSIIKKTLIVGVICILLAICITFCSLKSETNYTENIASDLKDLGYESFAIDVKEHSIKLLINANATEEEVYSALGVAWGIMYKYYPEELTYTAWLNDQNQECYFIIGRHSLEDLSNGYISALGNVKTDCRILN